MLPAIYFVFSRAGCDRSVQWLRESGVRLTTRAEADRIRERAESRAAWIDEEDLVTLGFYEFLEALTAGVAAHHAGMLPVFKETVEELFEAGLVKVVFATETLSLGINMPARTVVIEDLWKFQGERHEILTPGEYTQLTGRAGQARHRRRWATRSSSTSGRCRSNGSPGLAATRTYDLNSSFRPSYNMAVNLVRNYDREQAHQLLNSSFAQFLADRGVVHAGAAARARPEGARGLSDANLVCHLGDFDEYWALLSRGEAAPRGRPARPGARARRTRSATVVAGLRPGEVIHVPRARRRGLAVVLSSRDGKPTVLSEDRSYFRLSAKDFDDPPDRAHADRPAAVGELPERPVPPRRRVGARVAARQASTRGAAPRRSGGRARRRPSWRRSAAEPSVRRLSRALGSTSAGPTRADALEPRS